MNTVNQSPSLKPLFKQGDILKSNRGEYYILSRIIDKYVAISLATGGFWCPPNDELHIATLHLSFVGRDKKITIE